jgi:tetratricopeptide (TPR) repeat protein
VLEARRRVLGADHPDTLTSLNNLAGVYTRQGKQEECLAILVEVLGVQQRKLGELHPHTLTTLGNCAICLQRLKRWSDAEAYSRQALAGWAAAPGDNALMLAQCRRQLAETLTALEQFEAAEAELLEALAVVQRHPDAGRARQVRVLRSLVALYESWHSAAPEAGHDARAATHQSALASLQAAPQSSGAPPGPSATGRGD